MIRPATINQVMLNTTFFRDLSSLDENDSLFFALSEFSPAGIYLTNEEADRLYVNQTWQNMARLSGATSAYSAHSWKLGCVGSATMP